MGRQINDSDGHLKLLIIWQFLTLRNSPILYIITVMLERGSGFRRSACIEKMFFDEDGQSILPIPETSTGLSGFTTHITDKKGEKLIHENFVNTTNDGELSNYEEYLDW